MNGQQRKFLMDQLASKFYDHNKESYDVRQEQLREEQEKLISSLDLESMFMKGTEGKVRTGEELYALDVNTYYDEIYIKITVNQVAATLAPSVRKKLLANHKEYNTRFNHALTDKQKDILNTFSGELLFSKGDLADLTARINELFKEGIK